MSVLHYLNVLEGDCSIIQHNSGHVTVIDVNNAKKEESFKSFGEAEKKYFAEKSLIPGNFNQKKYPANPINYMKEFSISSIFRFILTHPDMDHMGGIKDFFEEFSPTNFWDTDNHEEKEFEDNSPYNENDWDFYKNFRNSNINNGPKRLTLYSGTEGQYYNRDENNNSGGDGLYILAPTKKLIQDANETGDYNDSSYVILYRAGGGKILFCGDSHNATWEHILNNHEDNVKNTHILIAPHHGRKSNRTYEFLEIVKPKITFFGNASSEHLAYDIWNYRKLPFITNNQANCIVVEVSNSPMKIFFTNKSFAEKISEDFGFDSYYDENMRAYFSFNL